MDYSYRNKKIKRNSRRSRRSGKRLVAIAAVALTAGVCGAFYGILSLFTDMKGTAGQADRSVEAGTMKGRKDPNRENDSKTGENGSEIDVKPVEDKGKPDIGKTDPKPEPQNKDNKKTDKGTKKNPEDTEAEGDEQDAVIKSLTEIAQEEAEKYFEEAAFIGDSRTQGLQINSGFSKTDFFAGRGLNVKNALTDKVARNAKGKTVTVVDALKGKKYKKIYVCFGINELGWSYPDIFISRYKELIAAVQKKQPDADVIVYSILPVTKKKNDNDKIFNMKRIGQFNKLIEEMAKEIGITYADLSPAVQNKKGFLPKSVTPDGIHMNREYCKKVLAYIANKKI